MSEDKSASNIKKIVFSNDSEKAIGRGKIGRRLERFDPNAIDGDNDGTVQEGTRFERPAGPQNMPKVKPIQVPRREDVPLPNRQPSRPSTPAPSRPSKPSEVPQTPKVPQKARLSGSIGIEKPHVFDDKLKSIIGEKDPIKANDKERDLYSKAGKILDRLNNEELEDLLGDLEAELNDFNDEDGDRLKELVKDGLFPGRRSRDENVRQLMRARKINKAAAEKEYKKLEDEAEVSEIVTRTFGELIADVEDRIENGKPELPDNSLDALATRRTLPNLPKQRLSGSIGIPDSNRFEADDEPFGEDIFSPEELDELLKSQDEALDELAEAISGGYDIEEELRSIIDKATNLPDPNDIYTRLKNGEGTQEEIDKWTDDEGFFKIPKEYADAGWEYNEKDDSLISPELARQVTENIQKWLENHPFNRNARNYEQREWADNEYDGQAERYAPSPTEIRDGLDIDWDNLAQIAGFTPEQKEDWELSEEELADRAAATEERLGNSPAAIAERAKVWKRVQDGEGFREIAPDYPDVYWSTVREMSRQGATEAGVSKQKSQVAESAAREKSRQRANAAAVKQLLEKMKNSTSARSLRSNLRDEIERIKEQRKRTSNEYQMIRKAQVEKWRLASLLYDTIPTKTEGESDIDFSKRMLQWFDESADFFEKLGEEINNNHDISTATDRAYNFYRDQVNFMESKLNDIDSFWAEVQEYKKGGSSSGGLTGSMSSGALPRGVRISPDAKATPVDSREFDAIRKDLEKISKGSFSKASKAKRPKGLSSRENSIYSVVKGAKDFSPRKKRKKPKKA